MKCTVCGGDKAPYEFFRYINRYDRRFFAAGVPAKSDVCFDCAGDYTCIKCGVTQPSTEFRIQGRICYTCQGVNPKRRAILHAYTRRFQRLEVTDIENSDSGDFVGDFEE